MISLDKIQMILRSADIEGLLADGAPEDEYDSEALEIWQEIETHQDADFTAQQLAQMIQAIWERSFGHEQTDQSLRDMYLNLAQQMLDETTS